MNITFQSVGSGTTKEVTYFVVAAVCLSGNGCSSVLNTPGIVRNNTFRFIDVCKKSASRVTSNQTRTMTAPTPAYCARHCLADPTCTSFNWKHTDHLCELVSSSGKTPVYQNNMEYTHYSPYVCPGMTTQVPKPGCAGEWKKFNGSYIIVCRKDPPVLWTLAREICTSMQADLIDLSAPGRIEQIALLIPGNEQLQAWIGCRRVGNAWLWVSSNRTCASQLTPSPDSGHAYAFVNINMVAEFVPQPPAYTRKSFICERKQ
ncbi:hypothetical protein LSAT2_000063 [Lamellibrachia satsuma]|nr:hypothetical protein LSAT2_000063 [Lamellibrachia satsuma]